MKPLLEFFVVFTIAILPHILYLFYPSEIKDTLRKFPNQWKLISSWFSSIGTILVVVYIAANQPDGLSSIGLNLSREKIFNIIVVAGLATGYLSSTFFTTRFRSKVTREELENRNRQTFETLGLSTFTRPLEKFASLSNLWLAVFEEELVYRGYLVLLLGTQLGTRLPMILLSIIFSNVIHLYQGMSRKIIFTHTILAIVFIVCVLATNSIFSALIPHLIYDTIWVFRRDGITKSV